MKVTDHWEGIIKREIFEGYTKEETNYPTGVCPSCRSRLSEAKKKGSKAVGVKTRESWNVDYEQFRAPSGMTPCDCQVVLQYPDDH